MRYDTEYDVIAQGENLGSHGTRSLDNARKPTSLTEVTIQKLAEFDQTGGHPLRRFYFRALVGVLGPIIVTGYYLAVWRYYLAPIDPNNPVPFGPAGAKWILYSWFVIGVVGLSLSKYGLEGVEASMLMEPGWNPTNGMKLMMHGEKTWSGPGGWMRIINWSWQLSRGSGKLELPSALWFFLAFPSIFIFIAYPISGSTIEITQGHLHGRNVSGGPPVKGFSYSNFNERNVADVSDGARIIWQNGLDTRILGYGALYTPQGYDRSSNTYLRKLPTVLPKYDGVTRVFLAAQAANPIEGNSWGLLMQYNCSIVDRLQDFRILSHRNSSLYRPNVGGSSSYRTKNGSVSIEVKNQTDTEWTYNAYGVMELGYEVWPDPRRLSVADSNAMFNKNTACYFNQVENITGDYPGIEQEQVFEAILWQSLLNKSTLSGPSTAHHYNFTLSHNITEMYGAYKLSNFLPIFRSSNQTNSTTSVSPHPMSAIGVQCKASSNVGTADIDGVTSTYSNFVRTDTPINNQTQRCAWRFGANVPSMVMPKLKDQWLSTLFTSVAAPPPLYASYTDDPSSIEAGTGFLTQLSYLQPEQLRQSMLRAYGAYAVQLMYNGGQGFTGRDGSHVEFQNPNVTEFQSGTVITRGIMPAEVPFTLFVAWALVGAILGVKYGFRRRWSAILDGYTMFRLGADLPEDMKRQFAEQSNTLEVEGCHGLSGVPGLVGDTKPDMWLGHIGLVGSSVAAKDKLYE
ncbi:hypothetical protein HBI26_003750 [Parastagonospora nodorum]|nr:hypothetical protein HBI26_003750 [Parastagonospora nodorum]